MNAVFGMVGFQMPYPGGGGIVASPQSLVQTPIFKLLISQEDPLIYMQSQHVLFVPLFGHLTSNLYCRLNCRLYFVCLTKRDFLLQCIRIFE